MLGTAREMEKVVFARHFLPKTYQAVIRKGVSLIGDIDIRTSTFKLGYELLFDAMKMSVQRTSECPVSSEVLKINYHKKLGI